MGSFIRASINIRSESGSVRTSPLGMSTMRSITLNHMVVLIDCASFNHVCQQLVTNFPGRLYLLLVNSSKDGNIAVLASQVRGEGIQLPTVSPHRVQCVLPTFVAWRSRLESSIYRLQKADYQVLESRHGSNLTDFTAPGLDT